MPHYPKRKGPSVDSSPTPPHRSAVDDPAVWVQLLRGARGLSQEELAQAAGMHSSQISAYETGLKIPRPATQARLAHALGTTPEAVLEAAEILRPRSATGPSRVGTSASTRAAQIGETVRRQVEAAFHDAALRG